MTRHCIALLHAFSTEHPAAANVGKAHIPEAPTPGGTSQTAPTRSEGGRLQTTLDPGLSITRISFESSLEARAGQWWTVGQVKSAICPPGSCLIGMTWPFCHCGGVEQWHHHHHHPARVSQGQHQQEQRAESREQVEQSGNGLRRVWWAGDVQRVGDS